MKKLIICIITFFSCFLTGCNEVEVEINYDELYANVESELLSANIGVTRVCSMMDGNPLASNTHTGSGVIFYEDAEFYYFLTNNHVTVKFEEYYNVSHSVYDYKENEYLDVEIVYEDPAYDLAVGKFTKEEEILTSASLGTVDMEYDDISIVIGRPEGESNIITFGNVYSYNNVTTSDPEYVSNIQFQVMRHSAYTTNGSSGGAVYNIDFDLVGISYAGVSSDGEFVCSFAVPIEKVNEFLSLYVWDLILENGLE